MAFQNIKHLASYKVAVLCENWFCVRHGHVYCVLELHPLVLKGVGRIEVLYLPHGQYSLLRTNTAALEHNKVIVHFTVVWETSEGSDRLL